MTESAPRYIRIPRPTLVIGRGFVVRDEVGPDDRGELDRAVGIVVDGGDLEGAADVGELLRCGGLECGVQVGDRVERGNDLLGPGACGPLGLERLDRALLRGLALLSGVRAGHCSSPIARAFTDRGSATDTLRRLYEAGLVHRIGDFAFPTLAATLPEIAEHFGISHATARRMADGIVSRRTGMSTERLRQEQADPRPVPVDDGAADHLAGAQIPSITLLSTSGGMIDLAQASRSLAVIYIYPRTGVPGQPLPEGWDAIPGARGCTPQSCAFRDHAAELAAHGASIIGLSAQLVEEQREFARREHIPYPLVSDSKLRLADAMRLPTFEAAGMRLYKRLTMIAAAGKIERVFYPVFPPEANATEVLAWLAGRAGGGRRC